MECRKAKISPVKSEKAKVWVFEQIFHPKSKGFHIFGVLIQKVFVSFRSERFSYLSDPEGFRIFLPAKSEFRVLAGNRLTHIFGDKNKY